MNQDFWALQYVYLCQVDPALRANYDIRLATLETKREEGPLMWTLKLLPGLNHCIRYIVFLSEKPIEQES
jgi:hypothetical protein